MYTWKCYGEPINTFDVHKQETLSLNTSSVKRESELPWEHSKECDGPGSMALTCASFSLGVLDTGAAKQV